MRLTLYGDPRTKKNSQRPVTIRRKGGGSFTRLLPSKAYESYEADCLRQIPGMMRRAITERVNIRCVYYMATRRRADLTNLLEATDDILVKARVLDDDNSNIVAAHDGSRVLHDKDNPRVEIEISPIE